MPISVYQAPSYLNVKAYGAQGDGSTDDTAAIQAVINNAPFRANIYFPAGNYIISSPLIIDRAQLSLIGEGEEFVTQLSVASTADPAYILIVGNTASTLNCTIRGLTFKGRNDVTTSGKGIAWHCGIGSIKQVRVIQFGGNGVEVGGVNSSTINDVDFEDVYITECGKNSTTPGDGLVIANSVYDSEYTRVIVAGNSAKNATRYGINNTGYSQKFTQCHAYFCTLGGYYQNGGSGTQIHGGEWETNASNNINIQNTTVVSLTGLTCFGGTSAKDITFTNVAQFEVTGCNCGSSTTDKNMGFYGCSLGTIAGNVTQNSTSAGLELGASTRECSAISNVVGGNALAISSTYCAIENNIISLGNITEFTGADYNRIENNIMYTSGKSITVVGTHTKVARNIGWISETSGTATLAASGTSITVNHGLAGTPTRVIVTPTADTQGARWWVSATTSTTFTITFNAAQSAATTFNWAAYLYDL